MLLRMTWLWLETLKNGIVQGSLIALVALAFSQIYRVTRAFHIAVGVTFLVGGYAAFYSESLLGLPMPLACLAGILGGILTELVIALLVYRHLMARESSMSLRLIASLGIYYCCSAAIALVFGLDIKITTTDAAWSTRIAGMILTSSDLIYVATAAFAIVALLYVGHKSRVGRSLQAIASNRQLYLALGHNEVYLLAFAAIIAGCLAGLSGAYGALRNGIHPSSGLAFAILAAVATIIGRKWSIVGPLIGALILGIARSATTQLLSDRWADTATYGLLIILVLSFRRSMAAETMATRI